MIAKDDFVRISEGSVEGCVLEVRKLEDGRLVAKVAFEDGFENWVLVDVLIKLDKKMKYRRERIK